MLNLYWRYDAEIEAWCLGDVNDKTQYDMAETVIDDDGSWGITWWITNDGDENAKTCNFTGTLEEMQAYVIALVRFGLTE